jgi:nifR3 family TIM-barrel protein
MLRIGRFQFEFPVVQAALSGYSDGPMRRIARRLGCQFTIHEVVLDKLIVQPGKFQKKTLYLHPDDHPVGGQLMGSNPEVFGEAAAIMADAGFDVIDINFGCPVKKVLGRCRGGFLLSDPKTAIDIVRRVRDAVPIDTPVTVKMRRGLDDGVKAERDFFEIFDAAFEIGVAAITVHGRTVKQRYVGPSRWQFLTDLRKRASDKTLLGSGDLFTADDIKRMLEETGVDGVTVARGCIGNPWIFREARELLAGRAFPTPPGVAEQGDLIRRHYELSFEEHGENLGGRLMRKFGIRYSELHPDNIAVRHAFAQTRCREDLLAVLAEWYDPRRDWPVAPRRAQPTDLIASGATLCDV